jgi:hypothetical protein
MNEAMRSRGMDSFLFFVMLVVPSVPD